MESRDHTVPRGIWRLAGVIVLGAFAGQLDTSVVNVGLETIGRDLGAPLVDLQWVSSGYLLALATGLPLCGWLGRRVGVGRLWIAALAAFTLASGLCAAAPNTGWLIAARVVQGLTAGVLLPAGQTILGEAVGPQRLGRVMGTLGIVVSLAPAIGPVVGGIAIDAVSWRWLFLVNVPLGVAGLLLARRTIPRGTPRRSAPLDRVGVLLVGGGLPALVYGLTRASERADLADPAVVAPLAGGAAALATYGWWATRRPEPLLDLRLLRDRRYAAATVASAFGGGALFGAALLFPLFFQLLRGEDALGAGVSLIAMGLGTAVVMPVAGRLTDRFGGGAVAVAGNALTIAATVPFAVLPADADGALLQPLLLLRGMAIGLAVMPVGVAAYAAVTREQLADATTQVNIAQRVGGALAGAVLAVVVAGGLDAGAASAFHAAFWWLAAWSLPALGASLVLWRASAATGSRRHPRPVRSTTG